jgi:hypothetical protein
MDLDNVQRSWDEGHDAGFRAGVTQEQQHQVEKERLARALGYMAAKREGADLERTELRRRLRHTGVIDP